MRKTYIVANWKMHPRTLGEARRLFGKIKRIVGRSRHRVQVIVCPPAVYLAAFSNVRGVALGAQDVSAFEEGAHTGEISARMLSHLHVSHVIIGHSERRAQGETNTHIAQKTRQALLEGLTTILCVGERERDDHGEYLRRIEEDVRGSLVGVSRDRTRRLMVAYEPVWAIGKTSRDALSPHGVAETTLFIRKILSGIYGRNIGMAIPILYGGSVEPENIKPLLDHGHADGFLVGHASLDGTAFAHIIEAV